jgi:putative sigma-54 modulation protein
MRLRVTSRGTDLKPDLKAFVERRVHFALGRFAGRVKAVSVRLAGVDSPGEGSEACCSVRVEAGSGAPLIVTERQPHIDSAVVRAVERVERTVQRQLMLERAAGEGPADSRMGS